MSMAPESTGEEGHNGCAREAASRDGPRARLGLQEMSASVKSSVRAARVMALTAGC